MHNSLSDIDEADWNGLVRDDYPFADYTYLRAMEDCGCVGAHAGWIPRYPAVHDSQGLAAATYAYIKNHSYGEYIFDWAWADAYARHGLEYYPKLVVGVPFTPATGCKLLVREDAESAGLKSDLIRSTLELAVQEGCSSVHFLFVPPEERSAYSDHGLIIRDTLQFHWNNRGYPDFEAFLGTLRGKRRHEIRRERARAGECGVEIVPLSGDEVGVDHARAMYRFYLNTIDRKMSYAYLTPEFFEQMCDRFRHRVVLFMARRNGDWVAGAIHYRKGRRLYGRYWGCVEHHPYLHFELCYYRAIEYAIEHGIDVVEAGAQGPQKTLRGFLPTAVHSAHWIADERFRDAIAHYVLAESGDVQSAIENEIYDPYQGQR